jgi:hypothetical protein
MSDGEEVSDVKAVLAAKKLLLNSIVLEIKIYSVQRVKGSRDKEGRTYMSFILPHHPKKGATS